MEDDASWYAQREQSAGKVRLQILWLVYRFLGKNVLKFVVAIVMMFIYPFARPARRSLRTFYSVLARSQSRSPSLLSPFSLFHHLLGFAWSLVDKMDACTLRKDLPTMSVRDDAGGRAFRELVESGRGAFLISTHLGTAEVLPALRDQWSAVRAAPHVHAFQQMGHDAVFTRLFMRHFDTGAVTLHAVEEIGVETAVRMQEAIGRGDLVLMAGDRVSAGSGKMLTHDFLGCPCRWPKGVFAFAQLMEAPVFFVTCVRMGWNAYEARFRLFAGTSGARGAAVRAALLDQYVGFLQEETREHPEQWYQFYDFFGEFVV